MAIRRSSELSLDLRVERFPYHQPFRISGHVFTETALLVAELSDGEHVGRGEGAGVYYLGDDIEHMLGQATSVRGAIERGATREDLQHLLPPGGARNALDCAFWELEARQTGQPVWRLAGLDAPRALRSTLTLGAATPERMAAAAQAIDVQAPVKVKLTGDLADDVARIEAILRRSQGNRKRQLKVADLTYDLDTLHVSRAGRPLKLNPIGLKLLAVLMQKSPAVVRREVLEDALWGDDCPDSDRLRSHIHPRRQVLDKPFNTELLHTQHGVGYRLAEKTDGI